MSSNSDDYNLNLDKGGTPAEGTPASQPHPTGTGYPQQPAQEPGYPRPEYQQPPAYQQQQPGYPQQPGFQQAGQGYQQPGYPQAGAPGYGAPVSPQDERTMATIAHVAGPIAALVSVGTLGWAVPLVIYLIYKDRSQFIRHQSAEALNFQITLLIGYVLSFVLMIVGIGFLTLPIVWVLSVVFGIIAAVAVSRGESYNYPVNIRMVS